MVLRYIPRGWPEEELEGSQDFPNSALDDWKWPELAASPGRRAWGHGGGNCILAGGKG